MSSTPAIYPAAVVVATIRDGAAATAVIARLEGVPFCGFHRRLIAILGAGMLFDAFDVYVISVVAVAITSFRITDATIGFIISASYLGQLVGSLVFGYFSERFGRKPAFVWALGSFGILSVVAAFSWSAESLVLARILQGLGIGALPPIAGAMFSEFLQARRRGRVSMLYQALYPIGATLSPFLGIVAFQLFDSDVAWRMLFLIGGLPFLLALAAQYLLPESPRWLSGQGRNAEALRVVEDMENSARSEGRTLTEESVPPPDPRETSYAEIFAPAYRARTILMWTQSFTAFFIVNAFTGFLPRLYTTVGGLPKTQSFALTMVFGVLELIFLVGVALVWDRTGRKPWFVGGYVMAVIGAAIAWAAFALFDSTGWIVLATAGMFMALGAYISVGGVYLYHPELFPTRMRSWATSTGRAVRSLASMIAPALVGQILAAGLGPAAVFAVFGVVATVGLIVMALLGVETAGQPLERIAS